MAHPDERAGHPVHALNRFCRTETKWRPRKWRLRDRPDDVGTIKIALGTLADAVRTGRVGKLALERIDGEPAISSAFVGSLTELGFQTGPRRLTLSA